MAKFGGALPLQTTPPGTNGSLDRGTLAFARQGDPHPAEYQNLGI